MVAPSTSSILSRRAFNTSVVLCSVFSGKSVHDVLFHPDSGQAMMADTAGKVFHDCTSALVSGGDFSEYLTEQATLRFMDFHKAVPGRKACVDDLATLFTEHFDAHQHLTNTVVGDRRAAVEMVFSGVHVGEFRGVPPTGRRVSVAYALHFSSDQDLISEIRVYGLLSGLMDQISRAPRPESPFQMV